MEGEAHTSADLSTLDTAHKLSHSPERVNACEKGMEAKILKVLLKQMILCFAKNIFLETYELFNIMSVQIWTAECDFNKDYCNKFDDPNLDIDNYYFLLHVKLL